jgi:cytochrome c oxidase assembly factor CtaG
VQRVAPAELAGEWRAAPFVLLAAGVAAALFAQAFVRLRRRGRREHASAGRALLFAAALAIATLALLSPLDAVGDEYLLSAHMLQHVLIGDAAPALAVVAVRGPLLFFLLPPLVLRPLARLHRLRTVLGALLRPEVAVAAWAASFAAWHVPAAYDYAAAHGAVHDLEHASFVLAGLLVWTQLVDPARRHTLPLHRRLLVAAVVFGAGQALSYVLIFSLHPLYPAYAAQPHRVFGISPLLDQRLAGLVMMLEQLLTLGTCALLLLRPYLRNRNVGSRLVSEARN